MGAVLTAANTAYRDFDVDGVPSSGAHEPEKPAIRALWLLTDGKIVALEAGQASGTVVFATKAAMDAVLTYDANIKAEVWDDSTPANNGVYQKLGASGAGSWSKIGDLGIVELEGRVDDVETDVAALPIRKSALLATDLDSDLNWPANTLAVVTADPVEAKNGVWKKVGVATLGGWEKTSLFKSPTSPLVLKVNDFTTLEPMLGYPAGQLAIVTADTRAWRNGIYAKIGGEGGGGWEGVSLVSDGFYVPSMVYYVDPTHAPGSMGMGVSLRLCVGAAPGEAVGNFAGGHRAGENITNGWGNTLLGFHAGRLMTNKSVVNTFGGALGNVGNTFVGYNVGQIADGALDNTFIGANVGLAAEKCMDNACGGINSAYNIADGSENAFWGHGTGQNIVGRGSRANIDETTTDSGNPLYSWGHRLTFIGDQAGRFTNAGDAASVSLTQAKFSTFLGAQTTSFGQFQINETVIGYKGRGRGTNTTVIGNSDVTETTIAGVWRQPTRTVATLPAAATIGAGARSFVTNASATTFASIVAGGGANGVPVYSDGTNWRIG